MCGFSLFWAEYPHPPISRKFTREGGAVSIFTCVEIRSPLPLRSGAGSVLGRGRPPGFARRGQGRGRPPGGSPPGFAAGVRRRGSPPGPGRGVPAGVLPPGAVGVCRRGGPRCTRRGFAARGGWGLPPGRAGVRPPRFAARGRAGVCPPGVRRPGPGRGLPAGVRRPGPAGRYARLSRRPVFARLLVTKKSQKDKVKISKT